VVFVNVIIAKRDSTNEGHGVCASVGGLPVAGSAHFTEMLIAVFFAFHNRLSAKPTIWLVVLTTVFVFHPASAIQPETRARASSG